MHQSLRFIAVIAVIAVLLVVVGPDRTGPTTTNSTLFYNIVIYSNK
jgi:hypothetical protein